MQRCLSMSENNDNASSRTAGRSNVSNSMMSLLREWARSRLITESRMDVLNVATGVSRVFPYSSRT